MNNTQRIAALESTTAQTAADVSDLKVLVKRLVALAEADAPAKTARVEAASTTEASPAPEVTTKPLSRSAWKALRTTKAGTVRKEFAGLTRDQAFEAGLCKGFHLPTGGRKEAIAEWKAAQSA